MSPSLFRPLLTAVSPAGASARLSVLIFHRVLRAPDPLFPDEVDAARFDAICSWLATWFNVVPLDQAVQGLAAGELPARAAAISFDDGYADNHDVALPILQRHGLPATFFVASSFLDGGRMWNDTVIETIRGTQASSLDLDGLPSLISTGANRLPLQTIEQRRHAVGQALARIKYLAPVQRDRAVAALASRGGAKLPDNLMMTSDQLRALRRAGMGVGAHTATHPILARLDADAARQEIVMGRQALEGILGERIKLFAYPNGKPEQDYKDETVAIVRDCGFDAAVTTAWGAAGAGSDRFQIPRFTPWDRSKWRFGLRLARNLRRA